MREVISTTEKFWVWGEKDVCQEVATEKAAIKLLKSFQTEIYEANGYSRPHQACKVLKVVWNAPLPEGRDHHRTVLSPVIAYRDGARVIKKMPRLSPSHIPRAKGADWWRTQYHAGLNDPSVQKFA